MGLHDQRDLKAIAQWSGEKYLLDVLLFLYSGLQSKRVGYLLECTGGNTVFS